MASCSASSYYLCYEASSALAAALLQKTTSPNANALRRARQLHALILTTTPLSSPPFLNNNLLSLYSKCGSLQDAKRVFDKMPSRNLISYNAIISAYSRAPDRAASALQLFHEMALIGLKPSASTFSSLVQASSDRWTGAAIHSQAVTSGFINDICIQTALIGMYSNCGILEAANCVFDEMVERDAIAWNSIILGNMKNGGVKQGLHRFCSMVRTGLMPTHFTFSIILNACGIIGDWYSGRLIHAHIVKSEFPADTPLQNSLLSMYSTCKDITTALSVFKMIEMPDLVSWNSMVAAYSDNGDGEKAMDLFIYLQAMSRFGGPEPDEYTFAVIVSATAALPSMNYGRPLHAQVKKAGLDNSIFVGSTLIDMYFKNDEPDSARVLFSYMVERDVIIWTEMIAGHSRLGEGELAIRYFYQMQEEGHKVDSFTLSSALNSSADLAALKQGEMIHSQVVKSGYGASMCVCGSLVDMYAKNGYLDRASSIFFGVLDPDLKCWNSMLGGYGHHGNAEQAFELFNEMVDRGLVPDHITYVSLLSACSHIGLVERGRFYWNYMTRDGIVPGPKHYACMVSLLSRAGLLQQAEELIMDSPFFDHCPELWRILLSSCVIFRNLAMGIHAAEQVLTSESDDSSTHILLSNLYGSVGRWDAVAEMRRKIRGLMLEKDPGLSWIEIKSRVHVFSADDETHLHIEECRDELQRLKENSEGWETSESLLLCTV